MAFAISFFNHFYFATHLREEENKNSSKRPAMQIDKFTPVLLGISVLVVLRLDKFADKLFTFDANSVSFFSTNYFVLSKSAFQLRVSSNAIRMN